MPSFSVYSATKAAIRSFARTWTMDLAPRKIRVNTLSPGHIVTPVLLSVGLTQEQSDAYWKTHGEQTPLRARRATGGDRDGGPLPRLGRQQLRDRGRLPVDGGAAQV